MSADTGPAMAAEQTFFSAWAESFSHSMGQIAGFVVPCALLEEIPAEFAGAGETDIWISCACSGGLRGELTLRIDPASALRMAQTFMSEPASPGAALTEAHREALLELFRQVAGFVASGLKSRWGEVQLALELAAGPPSWPASSSAWARTAGEVPAVMTFEMRLSVALANALQATAGASSKPEAVPVATGTNLAAAQPEDPESRFELLKDVELALTLRFGGRDLLLRDVLELCPGSVIELDRQVDDAVDILLDGRVLARGEVVVVGGNYGLRVREVVSSSPG